MLGMRGDRVVLVVVLVAPLDVGVDVDAPGTPIRTSSPMKLSVWDLRYEIWSVISCLPTSRYLQLVPIARFQE